ncbi:MAG: hypothetical protein PVJ05_16030, partial [Candidatus Thorarchaeota archaeon]
MSQAENEKPVEAGKVLGSIYGSLIIFFSILLFLSTFFSSLPNDAAFRSFQLIWLVGGFIVLIGAELGRVLFKSGVTIVGFLGFLVLNLFMIVIGLAVFADLVVPTAIDYPILLVVYLLITSAVWYIILALWT